MGSMLSQNRILVVYFDTVRWRTDIRWEGNDMGANQDTDLKTSILVVDDVSENVLMLSRHLSKQGYEVPGVYSGEEALGIYPLL